MLTPRQLSDLPNSILKLYREVEINIISDMARRLSRMDFIPSAQWQLFKLTEMGYSRDYILEELSRTSGIAKKELEKLIKEAAEKSLQSDYEIYRHAGLNPPTLNASPLMQSVLQAGLENTYGLFENLTRTTANTATKQFENVLDRAWLQITSGAFSHTEAVKMAVKDLASKGVASIAYPTGHSDYLEVAVRRAVVTGVNQTALKIQDTLADEMDCDLVETSAHEGARPSHAVWQGKIFSRSGTHPKYPDFRQSTGYGTGEGLGGWNCRHSFFPYFEGMEPVYSANELAEMNAKKYGYNGKKITQYEAEQIQRKIERNIRRWKREFKAMEAAGLPTDEAAAKLNQWHRKMDDFIKQTGLKRQSNREELFGFGRSEAAKARTLVRGIDIYPEKSYNEIVDSVRNKIRSFDTSVIKLNKGAQNKHIKGSPGYIPGRSYIYGGLETAQQLVYTYHGTGEIRINDNGKWINKEFISVNYDIGVWIELASGKEIPTNTFAIHYSKKGTHIVPAKKEG